MFTLHEQLTVHEIASAVKNKQVSATQILKFYLDRIKKHNKKLSAFTTVLEQRAFAQAKSIDERINTGQKTGCLAGVPFAVKNLFDIKDTVTLAGSLINQKHHSAKKDALLIKRLESEDAILVGALAMGEYAYDFTGENIHYGNCKNPWDISRMSGGSSSGSASAVASMLVPFSLGSDTNGSIRVPASFCGIFGLKPTYGRLPRTGSFPFCDSLDHLGPMARNIKDLSLIYDSLQGFDESDHACINKSANSSYKTLENCIKDLRIKRASEYFDTQSFPQAHKAVDKICSALSVKENINLPGAHEARSAAYLITNIEGSRLHLTRLQSNINDFDPDTRDRFIAGTMLPASWYIRALQTRHWFHQQALKVFQKTDIIIAPATPCVAPKTGEKTININGEQHALRPNLGYFTQPISAIGLPSCVVPTIDEESQLPIGVQIIAAPWREDLCLRVARFLETHGFETFPAQSFKAL